MNAAHPIFVPSKTDEGHLYDTHCPECGNPFLVMEQVAVDQNGVSTVVDRRGERIEEAATTELPGALVSLTCRCQAGHRFVLGFLHDGRQVRIYAGASAIPVENPASEPLWVQP